MMVERLGMGFFRLLLQNAKSAVCLESIHVAALNDCRRILVKTEIIFREKCVLKVRWLGVMLMIPAHRLPIELRVHAKLVKVAVEPVTSAYKYSHQGVSLIQRSPTSGSIILYKVPPPGTKIKYIKIHQNTTNSN